MREGAYHHPNYTSSFNDCSLTISAIYLEVSGFLRSEDGGSTVLRNDGIQPPHYTTQ